MLQNSAMINDFLVTDINENLDFCDEVLAAITPPSIKTECFFGNVYELKITPNKAILANLHDDKISPEAINLLTLQTILIKWRKKIIATAEKLR